MIEEIKIHSISECLKMFKLDLKKGINKLKSKTVMKSKFDNSDVKKKELRKLYIVKNNLIYINVK